eukprot:EG_transcript_25487
MTIDFSAFSPDPVPHSFSIDFLTSQLNRVYCSQFIVQVFTCVCVCVRTLLTCKVAEMTEVDCLSHWSSAVGRGQKRTRMAGLYKAQHNREGGERDRARQTDGYGHGRSAPIKKTVLCSSAWDTRGLLRSAGAGGRCLFGLLHQRWETPHIHVGP